MKTTGVIRRVDEMGRVVLPAELRRTMDIGERELLEVSVEGNRIVMKKYRPTCVFCDSSRNLAIYREKNVCAACRKLLGEFEGKPL